MAVKTLLGMKIDQTQKFTEKDGERIPVTIVKAGPCRVVRVIKDSVSGYQKLQLAFGTIKNANKADLGNIKGAGLTTAPLFLKEIKADLNESITVGTDIKTEEVFKVGDKIKVTGTSKGKGFAGVVKRHGFKGGPKTHGQSDRHRAPGSIGSTTTPGRVYKGKRMAGRMGGEQVTIKNLEVMKIDSENNLMEIKGLVPGIKNGLLVLSV